MNTLVGMIGGSVPSSAQPFIVAAAGFVAASISLIRSIDQGAGVYISMSWFAAGIFVPTAVPGGPVRTARPQCAAGRRAAGRRRGPAVSGRRQRSGAAADGDLVMRYGPALNGICWSTGTTEKRSPFHPTSTELDEHGRLTLRSDIGMPVWSSGTRHGPQRRCRVTEAGVLVIRDASSAPVWLSDAGPTGNRDGVVTGANYDDIGFGNKVLGLVRVQGW